MAARDNQGYLIAVIVLILLVLVLALVSFLGIQRANEYADSNAQIQSDLNLHKQLVKAHEIQTDVMKAMIGNLGPSLAEIGPNMDNLESLKRGDLNDTQRGLINDIQTNVAKLVAEYEKDMRMMLTTANEEQMPDKTYRGLIKNFSTALARVNADKAVLNGEIVRTSRDAKSQIEQKTKEVEAIQAALTTAQAELNAEKERHQQAESKMNVALDETRAEQLRLTNQFDSHRKQAADNESKLQKSNAELESQYNTVRTKLDEYERLVFDLPDGKIIRVANNIVYLNIGSDDGLRANQTFAIYDQTVTNFQKDQHKGSLEITKILGPHESEARITDQNFRDVILTSDWVLSATWDPGYRVPVALAGEFHLDNDGVNDRDVLIRMIERNGGTVISHIDDEGNIQGEIDAKTRFLVVGDPPTVDGNPKVFSGMREMESEAEKSAVQQIDQRRLLNWMGVHGHGETQRVDGAIGETFRNRGSIKDRDR